MMRAVLLTALATGGFCAVFAAGVNLVAVALSLPQVMVAGAISGFLGSLFAQLVVRRDRETKG